MTQNEWFEGWFDSPYYHILYRNRSGDEANGFVETIVKQLEMNPGDTLLDLACGKGRHAVAFAQSGLDVTGVDLSKESIQYAKQFEHEKLHFFVHDMRHLFRSACYNYVCNLFTSFGYFKSTDDNALAAQSIAEALKSDGKFLIDFVNRTHAVQNIELNSSERILSEKVEFNIARSYTDHHYIKDIYITDGENKLHFQERVQSFTSAHMKEIFQTAGLTFVAQYGNYEMEMYDEEKSPRMIMIFKK